MKTYQPEKSLLLNEEKRGIRTSCFVDLVFFVNTLRRERWLRWSRSLKEIYE
jgi:hypothetical protein